ncbi:hypothetical protein ACFQZE_23900 [Paenibacillus sp. GCM10027627]|uniref:hypothetical protein n=1 Tax=unclassified Paenibacillus TaxID=185978 RepID=UPI0036323226
MKKINHPPGQSQKSIQGGARQGAGRKNLAERDLVILQSRMSLPQEVVDWIDMCAKYRDGEEPKKHPERHRVDVIRDVLTAITAIMRDSGYTAIEQAQLIKNLQNTLAIKVEKDGNAE